MQTKTVIQKTVAIDGSGREKELITKDFVGIFERDLLEYLQQFDNEIYGSLAFPEPRKDTAYKILENLQAAARLLGDLKGSFTAEKDLPVFMHVSRNAREIVNDSETCSLCGRKPWISRNLDFQYEAETHYCKDGERVEKKRTSEQIVVSPEVA